MSSDVKFVIVTHCRDSISGKLKLLFPRTDLVIWGNQMKIRILGAALVLSLALSHAAHASDDVEPRLFTPDHYLSYRIMSFYQPFRIFLKDQFIRGVFNVYRPIKLLNPSDKLHLLPDGTVNEVKLNNPRLHYVAHELNWIDPVPVTKVVHIKNQFEEAKITLVTYPDRLLAPAAKRQFSIYPPTDLAPNPAATMGEKLAEAVDAILLPIPQGSHYLCYRIENLDVSLVLAVFRDQFWSVDFNHLTRTHLCNPAIKRHNNKVYDTDINDPDNHLVCYDIEPLDIFRKVLTRDQFGTRAAYVHLNDEVCVPTRKTEVPLEIPCGEIGADGECPVATNCPPETVCSPADTGDLRCICK